MPTPVTIFPAILTLCNQLAPGQQPIYLQVKPDEDSQTLDCFENVDKKIRKHGGTVQYGWQIWEWPPFLMIEAEFHAVWASPQGELADITPKQAPLSKILFLPDPEKKYEGRQINNVRHPLKNEPLILEFIQTCDAIFEALNKGDLATYHGPVTVPGALAARKAQLQMALTRITLQTPKPGRNEPCPCGSGSKYKSCHGKSG